MISSSSIFYMKVSAFICIFIPTIAALIMIKKYEASWKAFLLGAIVFTVAQPLLRIPILNHLGNTAGFILFTKSNTVLYIILLGLSAGIFEEVGRFFGLKFLFRERLSWENGIIFGLGHGGAEAFLLVGIRYINLIFNIASGGAANSLANVPSYIFLIGGLERLLAVTCHIGMTLLVLYAVKYKKMIYLLYAIVFHTLIDSPLLLLNQSGLNTGVWLSEGYVAIFAVLSLLIIVKFRTVLDRDDTFINPSNNN